MNFRKSALTAAVAGTLTLGIGAVQAALVNYGIGPVYSSNSNFTMLDSAGGIVGGTNDVVFTWNGYVYTSSSDYTGPGGASGATLSSAQPFFGFNWTVHDFQIFAPGSYSFDTSLGGGNFESGILNLNVGANQLGAHMLVDWNGNSNIDVALLWNGNAAFAGTLYAGANNPGGNTQNTVWALASIDGNGDGVPGIPLTNGGPFAGFNANFNISYPTTPEGQPYPIITPIPAAMWLFSSGLAGLFGFIRKRKTHSLS